MLKVFNLGFSKTGTSSLEEALTILGYRVAKGHWHNHHGGFLHALYVNQDFDEILRFTRCYDAFADAPFGGGKDLYKFLVTKFPDARFLLTIRDPDSWYRSLEAMLTAIDPNLDTALASYADAGFWPSVYWFRHALGIEELAGNRERIIACYNDYNREVTAYFEALNKPLLVLNLAKGEGWRPLCDFLGDPIPQHPFPHLNASEDVWLETKLAHFIHMRDRLSPSPGPLSPSPLSSAGTLRAEGRFKEAASLLEQQYRSYPNDPNIALETSFTAYAAGLDDVGSEAFVSAARHLYSDFDLSAAPIDRSLNELARMLPRRVLFSATYLTWLLDQRGEELRAAVPAIVQIAEDLVSKLHANRDAAALSLPDRLRSCLREMPELKTLESQGAEVRDISESPEHEDKDVPQPDEDVSAVAKQEDHDVQPLLQAVSGETTQEDHGVIQTREDVSASSSQGHREWVISTLVRLCPPLHRLRLQRSHLLSANQRLSAENHRLSAENQSFLAQRQKL